MEYFEGKVFQNGKIKVISVPGDGNCLFYAIVQQITGWKEFNSKFKEKANELRKQTVEYLWDHMSEMREVIMAEAMDGQVEGYDDNKCMETVMHYINKLSQDGTWGGAESIMAMKEILKSNFRIFNPLLFQYGNGSNKTIEIYYNGVNHYDSVYRREENEAENETPDVNQEQKDMEKRNDDDDGPATYPYEGLS